MSAGNGVAERPIPTLDQIVRMTADVIELANGLRQRTEQCADRLAGPAIRPGIGAEGYEPDTIGKPPILKVLDQRLLTLGTTLSDLATHLERIEAALGGQEPMADGPARALRAAAAR